MTEKKVTKVEMFERIKAQLVNEEDIAFIDKQIELTKKKNASKSKVDKNVDLRKAILDVFFDSNEKSLSCSEILKLMGYEFNGLVLTTQKVSPQLRKLVEEGSLIETLNGKAKTYCLAE